jgi:hypothetical protein
MAFNRISKADISDADIVDSYELKSDGYSSNSIYFTTTVVSTAAGTKTIIVNSASDGTGLLYSHDHPLQAGDIAWLSGTSAADGYYTVASIINDTTFTVNENIASSSGGSVQFRYSSGGSKVGINSANLTYSKSNNVQAVLNDLDGYVVPRGEIGQFLYVVESSDNKFVPAKPVINNESLIMVNDDGILIVIT